MIATMDGPVPGQGVSDRGETDALMIRLYDEVRKLAHDRLRRHRPGRGLQTTEVVHEVYLKLSRSGKNGWDSRAHFFGSAARAMKQVLFDLARNARRSLDAGVPVDDVGDGTGLPGDDTGLTLIVRVAGAEYSFDLNGLARHLHDLDQIESRKVDVVVCKFFAGMSDAQIAEFLGVSTRTVERDWSYARAWLGQRMIESAADHGH